MDVARITAMRFANGAGQTLGKPPLGKPHVETMGLSSLTGAGGDVKAAPGQWV